MKLTATMAVVSVRDGRAELRKALAEPGRDGVEVVMIGKLVGDGWEDDDGIDQGFQMEVDLLLVVGEKEAPTTTGRLSASEPNLQNIPVRTEEGRRISTAHVTGDTRPVKEPRRDANGNIIPWPEEADYFHAFDPENPGVPTD